ncbi:MAG TPA: hypothetical protein VF263_23285 [Longimicrobiaceae bacterium]
MEGDMRIGEIRNPKLFQALVRMLMIAERGIRYQVVDDAGGDGGLDGFDRETGELHAIYCPEKPERAEVERRQYVQKFRKDLAKAVELRDNRSYAIRIFAFVTPHALREPLQRQIRDEAKAVGFDDGICISGEALEVMLARHPNIVEHFPELVLPRLEAAVTAIREGVERLLNGEGVARPSREDRPEPRQGTTFTREQPYDRVLLKGLDMPELSEVEDALQKGDDSAIHQLALIRAEATEPSVLVAAYLIEQGHWFNKHEIARSTAVCEQGIQLAQRAGMMAEEATLRALLARLLAIEASQIDLERTTSLAASHHIGIEIFEPSAISMSLTRVRTLSMRIETEISTALHLVQGGGAYNLDAMYWTYAMVGAIEAYMLTPRLMLYRLGYGGKEEISAARQRILAAHEAAIRVSAPNGPEAQVRAYGNAANDLRLAGDLQPALLFARRAVVIAQRAGLPAPQAEILVRALKYDIAETEAAPVT